MEKCIMARFTHFCDGYVRDSETYRELPTHNCTLEKLPHTRGLYVATLDIMPRDTSSDSEETKRNGSACDNREVLIRIDTVFTRQLHESGIDRMRRIVLRFEDDGDPTMPPYLVTHAVAIQLSFDPIVFIDGLPLFKPSDMKNRSIFVER